MNAREHVLATLDRQPVDRIAVDLWYTPEIERDLKEHFKVEDDLSLYRALGLEKIVWVFPEYPDQSKERNRWGTTLREVDTGKAIYQEFARPGLVDYDTPESIEGYPYWPDPDKFDYSAAIELAKRASREFVTLGPWVSFYEVYCHMRGIEQAMMDLLTVPELVDAILDKIEYCQTEMMKRFFDRGGQYIDLAFVSDDLGSQDSLLISPDLWDRFIRDRLKRYCDFIHSYDIKVFYHSDGATEPMISRLIECGIDILNPIQHTCPGMDMAKLKRKYGDRIIFHGGVDNQFVLPFGTVEQVREETRNCLQSLGQGREGYICCSCHNVQAGTPLQNIFAMIETVRNEGDL